jgi:hypothetical protein
VLAPTAADEKDVQLVRQSRFLKMAFSRAVCIMAG